MTQIAMRLTRGSVLSITPDSRWTRALLRLESKGTAVEEWDLPFIGWAVVVTYVSNEDPTTDICDQYETDIEPVFLDDDGCTVTLLELRKDNSEKWVRLIRFLTDMAP